MSLPGPHGPVVYGSISSAQVVALRELGAKIQGAGPQVVGAAAIIAYGHGDLDLIPAAQRTLIEAYVAAETAAGRRLSGWLTNPHVLHATL